MPSPIKEEKYAGYTIKVYQQGSKHFLYSIYDPEGNEVCPTAMSGSWNRAEYALEMAKGRIKHDYL